MHIKKSSMNQTSNQIKFGQIKAVNFIIAKIMARKKQYRNEGKSVVAERLIKTLKSKPRLRLRIEGSCLKQEDKTPVTPNNVVNLFIVCELDR